MIEQKYNQKIKQSPWKEMEEEGIGRLEQGWYGSGEALWAEERVRLWPECEINRWIIFLKKQFHLQ